MKKHEKNFPKRAFAILLALALCMGMLPFTAVAKGCDHDWQDAGCAKIHTTLCVTSHIHHEKCTKCGDERDKIGYRHGHNLDYVNTIKPQNDKLHTVDCKDCTYVEVVSHTFSPATCTAPATCICGATEGEALEHDFRGTWVQVGTDGHAQLCVNGCNQPGLEESHTPDKWVTTQEPTCTAEGKKVKKCTACGVVLMTESIAKADHTWNNGVESTSPECEGAIVKTFTCTECGATKAETIGTGAGHAWGAGEVTKSPTCKEPGVMTYTCTKCSATKTVAI